VGGVARATPIQCTQAMSCISLTTPGLPGRAGSPTRSGATAVGTCPDRRVAYACAVTSGAVPASPDADVQAAMRRIWRVYDAAQAELQLVLRERLATHPDFGPLVRAMPPDSERDLRSHALLGAAMDRGEWEPYWDDVRAQAIGYANAEIPFASWVELVQMFRLDLIDRLFEARSEHLREEVCALDRWLDDALAVFGAAFVDTSRHVIARQQQAIRQLSTPVLQLRPGLLLLPIVGALDPGRLDEMRAGLLDGIRTRRARVVVVDVTGVPEIDTLVANGLIGTVDSARLMGAAVIVSGLSAEIAQTLVTAGVELARVESAGDLQSGIERAERRLAGAR
jgi:anti-anti-sigma regulatory factor